MVEIFLEWCLRPQTRNGTFEPDSEVNKKVGFRSVYGFTKRPTSSKGLNQYPVYSDTLFLDFDDGMGIKFQSTVAFFEKEGIGYSSYSSGSKGGHLHVPIKPMFGEGVPYSQKVFVEGLECGADISLYRHSSLIRLPNTVHDKTGKRKELIKSFPGAQLEIDYQEPPKSKFSKLRDYEEDLFRLSFIRYLENINNVPGEGQRWITMWSLSQNMCDSGLSFDTTLELMYKLNETWENPKEESEVLRAVKEAFK